MEHFCVFDPNAFVDVCVRTREQYHALETADEAPANCNYLVCVQLWVSHHLLNRNDVYL